jgi:hypothetical protein
MKNTLVTTFIGIALLAGRTPLLQGAVDPTSLYQKKSCQGFTILINPEVLVHRREAAAMQKELQTQLRAIVRVVPAQPLSALRKVWIWVEWKKKKDGAAEFHPSAQWLKEHGYNPEKAGHIEISNARNFVRWSCADQPWMLLHEFAHALYESVAYRDGHQQKAYALTNAKEYFAELSEAYFGKNDYYPFTRDELKKHDRRGFELMEEIWGNGGAPGEKK